MTAKLPVKHILLGMLAVATFGYVGLLSLRQLTNDLLNFYNYLEGLG